MFHPVLTLLVAGSAHMGVEFKAPADLAQIVLEITEGIPGAPSTVLARAAEPTVADVPYYYSDFTPATRPDGPPIITYDWRSPVIFDVP